MCCRSCDTNKPVQTYYIIPPTSNSLRTTDSPRNNHVAHFASGIGKCLTSFASRFYGVRCGGRSLNCAPTFASKLASHKRFSEDTERANMENKLCRCDFQVYLVQPKKVIQFWILSISGLKVLTPSLRPTQRGPANAPLPKGTYLEAQDSQVFHRL